jgi:hypothetical protein
MLLELLFFASSECLQYNQHRYNAVAQLASLRYVVTWCNTRLQCGQVHSDQCQYGEVSSMPSDNSGHLVLGIDLGY